ncbi:MAG: YraN family protein [Bacteroidota bacterium]
MLHHNWRFGKKEVDLVVYKDGTLIFVEIKTRSSFDFGFPEEAVTKQKKSYMKAAAEAFLEQYQEYEFVQFDIISILMQHNEVKELIHFEDAFY